MGRNRNFRTLVIALGMFALLGLPVTGVRAKEHPVPFKQVTTRDSLMITGMQGALLTFQEIQAGEGSHFGRVTWTAIGTVDPHTGAFSGTLTEVTANGDRVYGTFTGGFTGATSGLTGEGTIAFAGGTGRFQDLTGNATFHTYTDASGVTTVVEGRISY
jgi:hypothetical protein